MGALRHRIGVVLGAVTAAVLMGAPQAHAGIADPDPSFGEGGTATVQFGAFMGVNAAAIAPDGGLVAVGWAQPSGGGQPVAIAKLNADGTLDSDFSDDGRLTMEVGSRPGNDTATGVAVRPDGRILIGGTAYFSGSLDSEVFVAQLLPDGSLDESFANDGIVEFGFGESDTGVGAALALDSSGNTVVAGRTLWGDPERGSDVAIARLRPDGEFDSAFGQNGRVTTGLETAGAHDVSNDHVSAVEFKADGDIVFSGFGQLGSYDTGLFGVLSPTGQVESLQALGGEGDYFTRDLAVLSGGDPIAVGFSEATAPDCSGVGTRALGPAVAWSIPADEPPVDWAYQPEFDSGPGRADAIAVAALPDGRAIASAEISDACGALSAALMLLDPTSESSAFIDHEEISFYASDLATTPNGAVLAVGENGFVPHGFLVARFLPPTIDPPETRIVKGARGRITRRSIAFHFRSSAEGSSFGCKLDRRRWRSCESPKHIRRLEEGRHRFQVRAVLNGVRDPTPATRNFRIR